MIKRSTVAFIIDRALYRESDFLVSFFCREEGLMRGVAPSAAKSSKRFGGLIEPFNRLKINYVDRESGGLVRLETVSETSGLRIEPSNLVAFAAAAYFCEIVSFLSPEAEPHPELYDLLEKLHDLLAGAPFDFALIPVFELHILRRLGYEPRTDICINCGGEIGSRASAFIPASGGFRCDNCRHGETASVSAGSVALWRKALAEPIEQAIRLRASKAQLMEAAQTLPRFIEYIAGRRLKSRPFLNKVVLGVNC